MEYVYHFQVPYVVHRGFEVQDTTVHSSVAIVLIRLGWDTQSSSEAYQGTQRLTRSSLGSLTSPKRNLAVQETVVTTGAHTLSHAGTIGTSLAKQVHIPISPTYGLAKAKNRHQSEQYIPRQADQQENSKRKADS